MASEDILILVQAHNAKCVKLKVNATDTVAKIKELIYSKMRISEPSQNLIFGSNVLIDEETLENAGITDGCTIRLVLNLRGGSKRTLIKPPPKSRNDKMYIFVTKLRCFRDGRIIRQEDIEEFVAVPCELMDPDDINDYIVQELIQAYEIPVIILYDKEDANSGSKIDVVIYFDSAALWKMYTDEDKEELIAASTVAKVEKIRCVECQVKLKITSTYECRCEKKFCGKHRLAEAHGCTFDYKTEGRKELEKNNPKVENSKIDKI